jgi:hypothetical protein
MTRGNRTLPLLTVLFLATALLALFSPALANVTERTSGVQYEAAQYW